MHAWLAGVPWGCWFGCLRHARVPRGPVTTDVVAMLRQGRANISTRPISDLEVGRAQLGERLPEGGFGIPQATLEALHDGGQGIDGERGLRQLRWLGGEVDGGQLVDPHGVVGDHHGRWRPEQLATHLLHLGLHGLELGRLV